MLRFRFANLPQPSSIVAKLLVKRRTCYKPQNSKKLKLGNRLRFLCGDDAVAVAMHFAMKNGQTCFSLRKCLAISPATQKIASDCGCDPVVHGGKSRSKGRVFWKSGK